MGKYSVELVGTSKCGFVGVVAIDEGKVKFLSIQGVAVKKMVEVVVYKADIFDFPLGEFRFSKLIRFGTALNGCYFYLRIRLCQKHSPYANGSAEFKRSFDTERVDNLLYYTAIASFSR